MLGDLKGVFMGDLEQMWSVIKLGKINWKSDDSAGEAELLWEYIHLYNINKLI